MNIGRIERVGAEVQVIYDVDPPVASPVVPLQELVTFIRRFVFLTENQAVAVALWIVHTHAITAADFTPYLDISSCEKESGKSRLLEICRILVANPWNTENASPAAIVRKIHAQTGEPVTILLDERDSQFGGDKDRAEVIRGILNSGYERGGAYSRMVGEGTKMNVVDFQTFGAKAIAGIGAIADTVASRSIPIRMKRAHRSEVEKFRKRDDAIQRKALELKGRVAQWSKANLEKMREARPEIPEELSDRQSDCCEPLSAIADLVGGEWPETARRALVELCCERQANDHSIRTRLLLDIHEIFHAQGGDRISSVDLADELKKIEGSPWPEWKGKNGFTPNQLANLLRPLEITSSSKRLDGGRNLKAYSLDDFADVFSRYLPTQKRHNVTTRINIDESDDLPNVTEDSCDGIKNAENPNKNGPCDVVTFSKAPAGGRRQPEWLGPLPVPVECVYCKQMQPSHLALSKHLNVCQSVEGMGIS